PVQSVASINELNEQLNEIQAAASNVMSSMETEKAIPRQITRLQTEIQEHDSAMNLNKPRKIIKERQFWERVYTPRKNTICIADGCHSNCHQSCHGEYLLWAEEIGQKCWAFRRSDMRMGTNILCTECKHMAKYHVNVNDLWELK
ncbi:13391_t:CDS:2, partial [Acaulospora colombiana]